MNNKYVNRSKLSEAKFRELVRLFSMDLTAIQIAELTGLNRNTVNRYLKAIRERIAEYCDVIAPPALSRSSRLEEGKKDADWIGLREHQKKVHAALLLKNELKKLGIDGKNSANEKFIDGNQEFPFDLIIHFSRNTRLYLTDRNGYQANPSKFKRVEGFWGFARSRLEKFKGLRASTQVLHLKECEFRYNVPKDQLYGSVLKMCRKKPLF
jgi:transposase